MKKIAAFLLITLSGASVFAQKIWQVDPMHSKVTFSTTHLGISDITGLFKSFDVTATTSKADFSDAVFELSADIASINTEVAMRDDHLRSPEFFDAGTFPKMTFKSTSIKKTAKDRYKLTGNLTMHGITKPVTMDLWYRGTAQNPITKSPSAGFQLTGNVQRSDFNLGPAYTPPMLSDIVSIKADGEFGQQQTATPATATSK